MILSLETSATAYGWEAHLLRILTTLMWTTRRLKAMRSRFQKTAQSIWGFFANSVYCLLSEVESTCDSMVRILSSRDQQTFAKRSTS